MYQIYFGLAEAPFSIAPDPRYLYMSQRHQEALAHLLYGVNGGGGFVLLTGEVGAGKTTVCRCLLEQIPESCDVAYIFNPKLTVAELLSTICTEFGTDGREQLCHRQLGIEDVGDIAGCGNLFEQAAAYRSLAGSYFACEQHKSAAAIHAIEQMRECFLVALAHIEITRVRRYGERRFGEVKVALVHGRSGSEDIAPL